LREDVLCENWRFDIGASFEIRVLTFGFHYIGGLMNKQKIRNLVLVAGLLMVCGIAWSADSLNVKCIGRWNKRGGYSSLVDGNFCYFTDILCAGPDIVVFEISDPSAPVDTNRNYNLDRHRPKGVGHWGESMCKKGSLLYLTGYNDSTLEIIHVSDTLVGIGLHRMPAGPCDVWVRDSLAYIACSDTGLLILDVSDPASISQIGAYNTPSFATGVHVVGNYAYVADRNSGLRAIDVSDPSAPTEASSWNSPSSAYSVRVSGAYAYVADFASGLQVVDISDPDSIFGVGACNTPGRAKDVVVCGDYAYVADFTNGLRVINIKDPSQPEEVGHYIHSKSDCAYMDIQLSEPYVYITDANLGLFIFEFTAPAVEEGGNHQLATGNRRLSIHPNPFTHNAVVEFGVHSCQPEADEPLAQEFVDERPSALKIFDLGGRLVQETGGNTVGKGLEPGIYFLKAKGYEPVKIVKLR
jgi:hypothetical protein